MEPRLTPTSFVVLGLVEMHGTSTPYDLKRYGQGGIFLFWSVPHTQIYTECTRLAERGYLVEEREAEGRRRRRFGLTPEGREALDAWRANPRTEVLEVRDEGLLKLYFGAAVVPLADAQIEMHEGRRDFLVAMHEGLELAEGVQGTVDAGTTLEEEFMRCWERVRARAAARRQEPEP